MKSVAAYIRVVVCAFSLGLFFATAGTAHADHMKWIPIKLCIELEYLLGIIVGLTGQLKAAFSMKVPFFNVDLNKTLCVLMIFGFPLTSSSITRMFISEECIRVIQAAVNLIAFTYLLLTWDGKEDEKTKAQGDIEIVPGATIFSPSPPRRRFAKPKSLRQKQLTHRASR
jgi:hypothetical protein